MARRAHEEGRRARAPRRASDPITPALPQPQSWPLTMPSDSRPTPATSRTMPRMSESGPGCSSRLSRSRRRAGIRAGRPMARLTKKTQRQLVAATRTPPRAGPVAAAMPPVAPHSGGRRRALLERELGEQQRQRGRDEDRRARGLHDARGDQHLDRRRQPADGRGGQEGRDADEEHPPPAEAVRQPARRHQQRGEDDVVGVEDPGEPGERRAGEGRLDVREGDVDDGDVEEAHEDGDRRDEQRPSSVASCNGP